MKLNVIRAIGLTILLSSGAAAAQTQSGNEVPTIPETQIEPQTLATPYEFLATVGASNQFEIDAGNLALAKSGNVDVKSFAQRMINDHSKAQEELLAAGKTDKADVAKPTPDGEQKGMLGKLDGATPKEFDALYLGTQIFAHQRAIAVLKGYSKGNTALNAFAVKTLPAVVEHYEMATELGSRVKAAAPQ